MSLFNLFNKKKKEGKELLDLPCDYDGYDFFFKEGVTEPKLYSDFNNLITNNKLSINDIAEYKKLTKNSTDDTFITFYDSWINKLLSSGFVVSLDSNVDINTFTTNINKILANRGDNINIDVNKISEKYNNELKNYLFSGSKIEGSLNYDILEANIVASELRNHGYELICLFNGCDNNIKTIIRIEDIEKAKMIEEKIKVC